MQIPLYSRSKTYIVWDNQTLSEDSYKRLENTLFMLASKGPQVTGDRRQRLSSMYVLTRKGKFEKGGPLYVS